MALVICARETSLWRKVIDGKYGVQRGGWCLEEAQGPTGCAFGGI
jgi:hypothetical protein